jgi:LPXTG-site transpeptidase (sortase) family protein
MPQAKSETTYQLNKIAEKHAVEEKEKTPMPSAVPITFNPLVGPDGNIIEPINKDFSVIVPKLGINSPVVASVDPLNAKEYENALQQGVAHAKTSYFPDQDGAVYLFSHSTNYEWYVKDLNAIFYNLKNIADGDIIVVYYKGKRYTYRYTSRAVVSSQDMTYLLPVTGKKQLILQTCYPPGTTYQRLMIFADLVDEKGEEI